MAKSDQPKKALEKSALLHRALQLDTHHDRHTLLLEVLKEECSLPAKGYEITVTFRVTPEEIIQHKANNPAHLELEAYQHLVEMIQDCLYDGGPLFDGDFHIMDTKEARHA